MKVLIHPLFGAALLLLTATLCPAADGDAEWKKVEEVMQNLKEPKESPKSREEAILMMKKGLEGFDSAFTAALTAAPKDPRRWNAALFDALTTTTRGIVGLPQRAKPPISMEEIVNSPDAAPEVRSEASIMWVMDTAAEAIEKNTSAEWIARAERHLKDFPGNPNNLAVQKRIVSVKTTTDLKNKPVAIKFKAVDGREVDVEKLRGKVVLIDFWATWCPPCVAELPHILKIYKEQHAKGFEIIGMSFDADKAVLEAFVKEQGMEWPQYFDGKGWEGELPEKFGVQILPTMWLLNKQGVLVSTSAAEGLAEKIEKLLAE